MTVNKPKRELPEKAKEQLRTQLERLLVLIIYKHSMFNSKALPAAERNTRQCVYNGENSSGIWGGLPVVLLFRDNYQLMPVLSEGAIYG